VPWSASLSSMSDRCLWRAGGGGDASIRGPTHAGFNVTIFGTDFGPASEPLDVLIDNDVVPPLAHNHTHVLFRMPPGVGTRHISVSVKGQVG
jgi:hypothetical protein